jgi:hypothetical protein
MLWIRVEETGVTPHQESALLTSLLISQQNNFSSAP